MKTENEKYIIITGGFGFLGCFFSEFLIKNNFKVIIIDKNKPKTKLQKKIAKDSFLWRQVDITNENNNRN